MFVRYGRLVNSMITVWPKLSSTGRILLTLASPVNKVIRVRFPHYGGAACCTCLYYMYNA
jgi:hypothetical protein